VKLLLDEMWSPAIAAQLRQRGHDVESVAERMELRGQPDAAIFAIAQAEGRAIVTENVPDFRPLAAQSMRDGYVHTGLIFTSNHALPRGDAHLIGRAVITLEHVLTSDLAQDALEHWLT
jgi:hypothetical protein